MLSGVVVISSKDSVQHQGVSLTMEGTVNLQLSAKSVGVFEAFYNSVKVRASTVLMPCVCCGRVARFMVRTQPSVGVCVSVLLEDVCTCLTLAMLRLEETTNFSRPRAEVQKCSWPVVRACGSHLYPAPTELHAEGRHT